LENLALRHQLGVLQRSIQRPRLLSPDRLLWAWLCETWTEWRSALVIVKPQTVIAWHRKGFGLFWTWKIRRGKPGRPAVPKEVRDLIRRLCLDNPLWGAPRVHGELLKLAIDIGETSVGKYMVHRRRPPSQTWRTFLENHLKTMVSVDFFTVPTIRFQVLYVFLGWRTTVAESSTSMFPRTPLRNGQHSNCERPSPLMRFRATYCGIATVFSVVSFARTCKRWESRRCSQLRDHRGSVPTWNG
jgi:hypothetical protein